MANGELYKQIVLRVDVKQMLDAYKEKMAESTGLSVDGLSYNDVLRWMDKRLDNALDR